MLAGIAIEDRKLWRLIRDLSDAQNKIFGMRLFETYGNEAKAQKLLKTKVFKHAAQLPPFSATERAVLTREILQDGTAVSRDRLTALAQAKLAYVAKALDLSRATGARAFASIVPQDAPVPKVVCYGKTTPIYLSGSSTFYTANRKIQWATLSSMS